MAEADFPFIVSSGPKVPKDPAVRKLIRKQAMKDIGIARRKKGNGNVSRKQCPDFQETITDLSRCSASPNSMGHLSSDSSRAPSVLTRTTSTPESSGWGSDLTDIDEFIVRSDDENGSLQIYSPNQAIFDSVWGNLSFNPEYELARMKYGIDIVDLSTLTNFNVGKNASLMISADTSRLASIMSLKQWSYLEYVPSRYGSNRCLTDATNCLLAKAKMVLSPDGQPEQTDVCNKLYGKALRSLQSALSDDKSYLDADVLAATQLLGLHELLDPSRDMAWVHHLNGSAKLISQRSAKRFMTEFEKALLASHVGAMISETLIHNRHCYLEQPEWIELYGLIAEDSQFLTDRSPLAIGLRKSMFPLPGVWRDVHDWVNSDDLFFSGFPPVMLEDRCRQCHQDLVDWLDTYKARCIRLSLEELPAQELAIRRELFGSALECLVITKRLLSTVCNSERLVLEQEAQSLAQLTLNLQDKPQPKHSWLFKDHEAGVAYVILQTGEQWQQDDSKMDEDMRRIAIRKRYNSWSNILRIGEE